MAPPISVTEYRLAYSILKRLLNDTTILEHFLALNAVVKILAVKIADDVVR